MVHVAASQHVVDITAWAVAAIHAHHHVHHPLHFRVQACNRMSYQCVPLYDSLGENAIEFIINHSEAICAFVESKKLPMLAKAIGSLDSRFKHVVYWGTGEAAAVEVRRHHSLYAVAHSTHTPVPSSIVQLYTMPRTGMQFACCAHDVNGGCRCHSTVSAGPCLAIHLAQVHHQTPISWPTLFAQSALPQSNPSHVLACPRH